KQQLVEGDPELGAAVARGRGQAGQNERIAVDVRELVGEIAGVKADAHLVVAGQLIAPEHRLPTQFGGIECAGYLVGGPVEAAAATAREGLRRIDTTHHVGLRGGSHADTATPGVLRPVDEAL